MWNMFNSVVRVERLQLTQTDGMAEMSWSQATDPDPETNRKLQWLPCRIDMMFVRPGKDYIPAPEAGRAPDRYGVLFTDVYGPLKAGDRIVTIPDEYGLLAVNGTFEIRVMPDKPMDFSGEHHIEVQIVEVAQQITNANWPGEDPLPDAPVIPLEDPL